jgi:pilus assembly protein Flp/PilA
VREFASDAAGATAIEYGLLAALMSMVVIGALSSMGSSVNGTMTFIANSLR